MILIRKHIAVHAETDLPEPSKDGFWCYNIVRCKGHNLAVISVYQLPDDEAQNANTRLEISRFIYCYRGPYMILGDWNQIPEDMSESGWEVPGWSQYATPQDTHITCRSGEGSMIDYGIVSHDVKHGMTTLIDHGVPTRPHYGVVHLVKGSLCKIWTKQLIRPGKMRPTKEMKVCDTMDWATASRVASQQSGRKGIHSRRGHVEVSAPRWQ